MNASRGNRNAANRERTWKHYERATRIQQLIYLAPPNERLGVMKDILSAIPRDAGLRNILTDPKLLREEPRRDNRLNVAKAAHAYVRLFFGLSIKPYIKVVMAGREPVGIPLHAQRTKQARTVKPTARGASNAWPTPKAINDLPSPQPGWFTREFTPSVLWSPMHDLAE